MASPPSHRADQPRQPGEFTIRELADDRRITGSRSKMSAAVAGRRSRQRRPDIAKARAALGWEPTVEAREGLERTIAYFRTLLAEEVPAG